MRIDLDLRGHSEFERDVWRKALDIPRGEVRPYGWIAARDRPAEGGPRGRDGARAQPRARSSCRATGSSAPTGRIGQYSLGGPENKRTILASEGLDPDAMEAAARRGERLVGCASTHIVCWPTCRTGRHMLPRNRRPFRSLGDAADGRLPARARCVVPLGAPEPRPPDRPEGCVMIVLLD